MFEMPSDFKRLTTDYSLLTHVDTDCLNLSISYGEKSMRVVQMDMAWHPAPQKVRVVDTAWTICLSKGGHKKTIVDAHHVHITPGVLAIGGFRMDSGLRIYD